jgi:WD40 repeat protein
VVFPVSDSAAELLLDKEKPQQLASFDRKRITTAAFDATGSRVGFGFADGSIAIVDAGARRATMVLEQTGHKGEVTALTFSLDGKTMLSGGEDSRVFVWDMATKTKTKTLAGHNLTVTALQFGMKSGRLFSLCAKRGPLKWDTKDWRVLETYGDLKVGGFSMAVSADERMLVVAGYRAELYDLGSGQMIASISPPRSED